MCLKSLHLQNQQKSYQKSNDLRHLKNEVDVCNFKLHKFKKRFDFATLICKN